MFQSGVHDEISSSSDVPSPAYIPPSSDSDSESDADVPEAGADVELVGVRSLDRDGSRELQVRLKCNLALQWFAIRTQSSGSLNQSKPASWLHCGLGHRMMHNMLCMSGSVCR